MAEFDKTLHPRASKVASTLYRYYAEHKTRVTLNSFRNELHSCLAYSEADKLFEYYSTEEACMQQSLTSTRVYSFICSQDHFNCVAVSEALKKCNIRDEIFGKKDVSHNIVIKSTEPKIVTKTVEKPVLIQSEPIEKIVYKEKLVYKDKDYSSLSVSALDAEIKRLEDIRDFKKKQESEKNKIQIEYNLNISRLTGYCRKLGCQRNELRSVLTKIVNLMDLIRKTEKDHPFVLNQ